MKEIKLRSIDPVSEIKSKLWESLNLLRGSVSLTDFHFILFLLTLQRNNLLDKIDTTEPDEIKHKINVFILKFEGKDADLLKELYEFYRETMYDISDINLYEIIQVLRGLDQMLLKEYFSEIFDDFLYNLYKSIGKLGGESVLPKEVASFICSLAELTEHDSVYNPFAGIASFAVFLENYSFYKGQELNYSTWALGLLRIMAYNKQNNCFFEQGNSIENWGNESLILGYPAFKEMNGFDKFDLIIADPPFNLKLTQFIEGKFGPIKNIEHFLIEKGLEDLNSKGKLIAVLSQGVLFRSGPEELLRRHLVENDLIEMVISMPGGLLMQTSIPFVLLVINKNKKKKGFVRFVDSIDFVKKLSGREKYLAADELLNIIKSDKDDKSIRLIPNKIIVDNEYNLNVARYFIAAFTGVSLKTLLTPLKGEKATGLLNGKIIRIKDLKDDKFNYNLEVTSKDETEIPITEQFITESCMLLASVGGKLKPTYFNYTGTPIYVSTNILVFKIDKNKVDPDYLVNELHADYTVEQLYSYFTGSTIPRIKKEDLLNVKIELLQIPEQKAKIKGLREDHIKNKERELLLEKQILGLKDDAFRDFASIKHTFRQYLNAMKSNVSGTKKFLENNIDKNINLNTIYSKNLNQSLGDHLLSLVGIIDSMSGLLHTDNEQFLESAKPVENDLIQLIEKAQLRFADNEIFQFEQPYFDQESFTQFDGGIITPMVYIHPEDFFRVFANIVSNAIDHGFKNRKNNLMRTSVSFDADNFICILEVSNNGNPIPETFTLKHLTTRGEKTTDSKGSGVGGADIKSILEKYNGFLEIKNDKNAEFPVTYIIGLPIVVYQM